MKHFGSIAEHEHERSRDLVRAYLHQIQTARHIRIHEIFTRVVKMPAARFYVSEERAAVVLGRMFRGDSLKGMRPNKRAMFQEIYRRACELKAKHPELSTLELASIIVRQPAPCFYLTPASAKVIYYRIRNRWKRNKH